MIKKTTHRITLFEPDEAALNQATVGRDLSPGLAAFLRSLLKRKKWARKINIPSGYNDVAAVLVFAASLKEQGLEIFSEIHVYFAGNVIVEKWEVVGECERIALLPKELFRGLEINKVWVEDARVRVEFSVPRVGGQTSETFVKTFDFSGQTPVLPVVPSPVS